jgi:DNA-binding MarR family transcriptional regulator
MPNTNKYSQLRLGSQLCFPLYAAAKEVVRLYAPLLEPLGLTYTHYIVLMVLWEQADQASVDVDTAASTNSDAGGGAKPAASFAPAAMSVSALGQRLYLDSGTLTPVLKKMEAKGLVRRERSARDERVVEVSATPAAMALRERCLDIPKHIGSCVKLEPDQMQQLYDLLYKVLGNMHQ